MTSAHVVTGGRGPVLLAERRTRAPSQHCEARVRVCVAAVDNTAGSCVIPHYIVTTAAPTATAPTAATPLDRAFQLGYKVAYRLMRASWRLTNPLTHGAVVLIWSRGEVLLVRNSYVPYYSAPGGFVKAGEDAREAARRELEEEVGLHVPSEALKLSLELTHPWEYKRDHVKIYELQLEERPIVNVDHREVVEALWIQPEIALGMNVFPPLKRVIRDRLIG